MPRPDGDVIVVSDLDGTIAHRAETRGAVSDPAAGLVSVQTHRGLPISSMTRRSARIWSSITATGRAVLVTTRSVAQYRRIRLPGVPPALVFAANGGQLIVEGDVDEAWQRRTHHALVRQSAPLLEIWREHVPALAAQRGVGRIAVADDLFITAGAGCGLTEDFAGPLADRLTTQGWRLILQERGVYLMPRGLDKAVASREAAERLQADRVVAGGDSWLDASMLICADHGIRPAHGQLHEAGWTPGGIVITESAGVRAGEEIVAWYATHLFGTRDS